MTEFHDDRAKTEGSAKKVIIEKTVEVPKFVTVEIERPVFVDTEYEKPIITDKEYERPVVTDKEYEKPVIREVAYEKPVVTDREYERPIIKEKEIIVKVPVVVERPYDVPVPNEVPYDLPVVSMDQVAEVAQGAISMLSKAQAMLKETEGLVGALEATVAKIKDRLPAEIKVPKIIEEEVTVKKPVFVTETVRVIGRIIAKEG